MKTLTVYYSEKRNHASATDGTDLYRFIDGEFVPQNRLPHEITYQVNELNRIGTFFTDQEEAISWTNQQFKEAAERRAIKKERNKAIQAEFEANLSDFWKDVDSRVGMDVCTPFKNKYPRKSFVAYDAGFVWCTTDKTAYLLKGFKSMRYLPKTCKKTVMYGDDI